jgi:hypothetical protein
MSASSNFSVFAQAKVVRAEDFIVDNGNMIREVKLSVVHFEHQERSFVIESSIGIRPDGSPRSSVSQNRETTWKLFVPQEQIDRMRQLTDKNIV